MHDRRVPDSLVTLGAQTLLVKQPLLSKSAAREDAAAVLNVVLGYLRHQIENGPHDYECALNPPSWVSEKTLAEWDYKCDCTVLSVLTLLDTGRFPDRVEEWMAQRGL